MESPDVVRMVDESLSADVVDRIAEAAGETSQATGTALRAAVPGVFRLLHERAKDPAGAAEIVGAIRETSPAASLNDPAALLSADPELTRTTAVRVLGPGEPELAVRVAEHAGVSPDSADGIVRMATPLALGALARTVSVPLGQENLLRLFREQQGAIDRADPFRPQTAATGAAMAEDSKRSEMSRLLPGLIIMIVLLAVLFFALRACGLGGEEPKTETVLQPTTPGAEATTATVTPPTPPAEGVAVPQPPGLGEGGSGTPAAPPAGEAAPAEGSTPPAAPNER